MIKKWCTAVFITVAVLVTILSIYTYKFNYLYKIREFDSAMVSMKDTAKTIYDNTFISLTAKITDTVDKLKISKGYKDKTLLNNLLESSSYIDDIILIDNGESTYHLANGEVDDKRIRQLYNGKVVGNNYSIVKSNDNIDLYYVVSGYIDEGNYKMLMVGLNMMKINHIAKPENYNQASNYMFMVSNDGYILFHPDRNLVGINIFSDSEKLKSKLSINDTKYEKLERKAQKVISEQYDGKVEYELNNLVKKSFYSKLDTLEWYVFISADYTKFKNNAIMETLRILFPLIICLLISIITLYLYIYVLRNTDYYSEIKNNLAFSRYLKKSYKKGKGEYYFVLKIDNIISSKEKEYVFDDSVINKVCNFFKSLRGYYTDIYRISRVHFVFVLRNLETLDVLLDKIKSGVKKDKESFEIRGKMLLLTIDSLDPNLNLSDMDEKILHQMNEDYINISEPAMVKCIQYNEVFDKFNNNIKDKSYVEKMIKNQNIIPFFQPIVNLSTNEVIKHEVLMRVDDKSNLINTIRIIEIAEKEGLVEKIDKSIITQSFHMYRNILEGEGKRVSLSINLSSKSINAKLIDFIMDNVKIYKINPEDITFELTETAASEDLDKTLFYLKSLRQKGFKIAIDDFGTGYAHVELLSKVDVDYIKIDGVFVMDAAKSKKKLKTLNALVYLAKNYDTEIIAEFIEDQNTIEILKRLNVEFGQGYYFGKPGRDLKVV